MRKTLINDPYRNPFHNRFNVPVHSRLDEMQSNTQVIWLNDRSDLNGEVGKSEKTRRWIGALAGAFALVLVVIFSAALLSR
jgi:hypothetical protein